MGMGGNQAVGGACATCRASEAEFPPAE